MRDAILEAIAVAQSQTDQVEQRAVALLHERGHMSGLTCAEQRKIEGAVRELLVGA